MTFLITGGAGFIGSNLVHRLAAEGAPLRVLDDFSTGKPEFLSGLSDCRAIEIVRGQVQDLATVARCMVGISVVVHLAAICDLETCQSDPQLSDEVNVQGTENVLHGAREAGVPVFLFASSAAVYGAGVRLPHLPEDRPDPRSTYGRDKYYGERLARMYARLHNMSCTSLRLFNVYGEAPDRSLAPAGVVSEFVRRARSKQAVVVHGDGSQTRDFVHVQDAVSAIVAAVKQARPGYECLNVASGTATSIAALVRIVERCTGIAIAVERSSSRPWDIVHSVADISRTRARLAIEPQWDLDRGIQEMLRMPIPPAGGKP